MAVHHELRVLIELANHLVTKERGNPKLGHLWKPENLVFHIQ